LIRLATASIRRCAGSNPLNTPEHRNSIEKMESH